MTLDLRSCSNWRRMCEKGAAVWRSSACCWAACHLCMDVFVVLSSPFFSPPLKGMMGAYGPPYMPMQGSHEGLLSVAPMPPHPTGGPHLPPHHLGQGMPGYPGMLHQGKGPLSQPHPVLTLMLEEGSTWSTGVCQDLSSLLRAVIIFHVRMS